MMKSWHWLLQLCRNLHHINTSDQMQDKIDLLAYNSRVVNSLQ